MRSEIGTLLSRWRLAFGPSLRCKIAVAWTWWTRELIELLPPKFRRWIANFNRRIYLLPEEQHMTAFEGTPNRLENRGRFPVDRQSDRLTSLAEEGKDIVLLLPAQQTLARSIVLPAATEEDLRGVLAFEMDRQTPFSVDQVYYDWTVTRRSAKDKTIEVELVLTPKRYLDLLLTALAARGIELSAVCSRSQRGALTDANLLPADRARPRPAVLNGLNAALGAVALALTVTAIALPIQRKLEAIRLLEPRVEAAMEAAREGSRIRDNIEKLTSSTLELIRKKESEHMVMSLLNELTRIVPDDTWANRIEVSAEEIQLLGQSPSAARIITLLEAAERLADPQFRSPVTQVPNSDEERFHVSARWAELTP